MSWICKKCETENPDSIDRCGVCFSIKEGVYIYSIKQSIENQRKNLKMKGWLELSETIPPPLFKSASTAEFYHSLALRIMNNESAALYLLSEFYFEGKKDYPKNHKDAVKWYKKAASNGHKEATKK